MPLSLDEPARVGAAAQAAAATLMLHAVLCLHVLVQGMR